MSQLRFEKKRMKTALVGMESSVPDLVGILQTQNQLDFEEGIREEINGGYGRVGTAYPYRQLENYDRVLTEREIDTAVLENSRLRAVFLTGFGGRFWELWDKETGKNLLYTNDVLRFSNLAVRNAWFSGGVEWNIGVIGHNPLTTEQLYVARTKTDEGEPVLRMYEYERIRQITWQMDFWLEEDSAFLNCRMRIMNESEETVPMYWWSNMAVPEFEGGRVIVPADSAYTNAWKNGRGLVYKVPIPVVDCVDVTDYGQIPRSVDYFFDVKQESPKYIANVDKYGAGLLQMSTDRLQGRKLFSWGHTRGADRWQEYLTEEAGPYVEIQAGLAKTQYGCIPMEGGAVWQWLERYGAVQVPKEDVTAAHESRRAHLTEQILAKPEYQEMEQILQATEGMAVRKAELLIKGSGYGVFHRQPSHLEFVLEEESLKKWKRFFETGELHRPEAGERPDQLLITEENIGFLEKHMSGENEKNWYAWYHLGLGYYLQGRDREAEEALKASLAREENPWAYHALGCVYLRWGAAEAEKRKLAMQSVRKGISMNPKDISYLKDGFRILLACEEQTAFETVCEIYEAQEKEVQANGRMRFLYLTALHKLGRDEQAFSIIEEKGLEIPDVREAEDGPAQLWLAVYQAVHGEEGELPYPYDFRSI